MNRTKRSRGTIVSVVAAAVMTLLVSAGCGGGMLNVKKAFDANPKMAVMEFPVKTDYIGEATVGLSVPARTSSRAPQSCNVSCIVENEPMPAEFREIAQAIHGELKTGLGKPDMQFGAWSGVPSKKAAFGIMAPDWGKTDYEIVIWPNIYLTYSETIKPPISGNDAEYSYKLDGSVTLMIWRKNAQGNLDVVRPNITGQYSLGEVFRKIEQPATAPLTIAELEKILPSTTILNELKEKSIGGIKRFVKEIKEAK